MKTTLTALLLSTAPIFAGEPAPIAPAPSPCDCPEGWTIGLEAMAMKAYPGFTPGGDTDTDYEFAGRASVGYEFGDCMFVRATGFWFSSDLYDQTEDFEGVERFSGDVDMAYYDLVVGQHFTNCGDFTLSPYVGLRYATVDRDDRREFDPGTSNAFSDKAESDWDGLGVVVGIDGTRSLGNSFSLYGTAKQSILFGTTDYSFSDRRGPDASDPSSDDVVFISELGLGVQYDFSFSNVASNIRLGVEGQYWTGGSGNFEGSDGDIGLLGFVLGANFRF